MKLLEARCLWPQRFDLARHWAESLKRFETELNAGEATVAATVRGLTELRHLNAALARALREVVPPGDGARVQARLPIESIAHAAGTMLRPAPEVEVLQSKALRRAILDRARSVEAL